MSSLTLALHDVPRNAGVLEIEAREQQALQRLGDDHPAWPIDAIALSPNARAFLASVNFAGAYRRVLGFWDHSVREISTSLGAFGIDPAGAYRLLARA